MAAGFNVTLRNAMLNAITTATGSAGLLRVYNGTRPATGASAGGSTLLAEATCGSPFAPSASGGVLSPTLPASTLIVATAEANWWRLLTSGAVHVMDGSVGVELIINFPDLVNGEPLDITSWTITSGNA